MLPAGGLSSVHLRGRFLGAGFPPRAKLSSVGVRAAGSLSSAHLRSRFLGAGFPPRAKLSSVGVRAAGSLSSAHLRGRFLGAGFPPRAKLRREAVPARSSAGVVSRAPPAAGSVERALAGSFPERRIPAPREVEQRRGPCRRRPVERALAGSFPERRIPASREVEQRRGPCRRRPVERALAGSFPGRRIPAPREVEQRRDPCRRYHRLFAEIEAGRRPDPRRRALGRHGGLRPSSCNGFRRPPGARGLRGRLFEQRGETFFRCLQIRLRTRRGRLLGGDGGLELAAGAKRSFDHRSRAPVMVRVWRRSGLPTPPLRGVRGLAGAHRPGSDCIRRTW